MTDTYEANILNDLETFPEIPKWTLTNLFTDEESLVTKDQLLEAFGEEGLMKIKSGRNTAWLLTEHIN